ncbi:efflux RND transporter permease subunit [Klebsiella pneumoniae]|nr:efflux RND transporter permease subunit [Klebsiella pneumoniae]
MCHGDRATADLCRRGVAEADPGGAVPGDHPPVVNVSASWPGASASDVAEAIAAPLETQLNGVDHMLYMESTSSDEGTYRLSITFAAGTDADLAAIDVQNRVAQALAQLPAEVQQNGVQCASAPAICLWG